MGRINYRQDEGGQCFLVFEDDDGNPIMQSGGFAMRAEAYEAANRIVADPPTAVVSRNGTVTGPSTPLLSFLRVRDAGALIKKVEKVDRDLAAAIAAQWKYEQRRVAGHKSAVAKQREARS